MSSPFAMQPEYFLWFVVRGQRPCPSQVNISPRCNIDKLKEAIREKGFQNIPVTQMILWKLNKPIPLTLDTKPDEMAFVKKVNNIILPDLDSDYPPERASVVQLRNVSRKVSDCWADKPQSRCLHLIVQVLALERPTKRQRLEEESGGSEERDNDDFQGYIRGTTESEDSRTSTPSPPRRSDRKRVKTPKTQVSANRKETTGTSKGEMKDAKNREIDNKAQAYWTARCNRCEVKDIDCYGPPFKAGELSTKSERCQRCTSDKQKCTGGVSHYSGSTNKPESHLVTAQPTVGRSTPTATVVDPRVLMDEDSPRVQKRSVTNIFVDVPPSKLARISKPSVISRRGGLTMSTGSSSRALDTTSFLSSRTGPLSAAPPILDKPEPADDSVLIRLDGLEAMVRRTHDDLLNRIGFIRQEYLNQPQRK